MRTGLNAHRDVLNINEERVGRAGRYSDLVFDIKEEKTFLHNKGNELKIHVWLQSQEAGDLLFP